MKLEDALALANVPPWWQYTRGRGVRVAVIGTPAGHEYATPINYGEDEYDWHEQASAYLIRQIAPEAEIFGLAFFGEKYKGSWRLQDCLRWCLDNKVDILSMSFYTSRTDEKEDLLRQLVEQGCIPFAAAGNRAEKGVTWPGSSPYTVCVGAYSDLLEGRDYSSGIGEEVTLLAPTGILVPTPKGYWTTYPDTSGATPVAAGMATLWKAITGGNMEEFLEFVKSNTKDLYEPSHDKKSGYGLFVLPDPSTVIKKEEPKMLKVCFDPGHGGSDPGAVGPSGLREKDVTLGVALRVAEHLRRHGAQVKLTREDDRDVSLEERCRISNEFNADVFLSIHCNSATNRDAHGTETWYCSSNGLFVARKVQEALVQEIGRTDRGCKSMGFYVLKNTRAPAALTELAFISNLDEEKLLASPDFQEKAARAVAKGVLAYLGVAWQELPKEKEEPRMIFKDVPNNHWAKADIETVVKAHLMSGYPDGRFGPDEPVTRAQLAAVMARLLMMLNRG